MDNKIVKDVKYLKIYAGLLTFAFIALLTLAFVNPGNGNKKVTELTAQRINIVSPKGKLRMVISNSKMQSPGRFNGKKFHARKRPAGMIFFNEDGDEVGGLIYKDSVWVLSIDQYKRDQIMQLQYEESKNGMRKYGMQLWDRNGYLSFLQRTNLTDSLRKLNYNRKKINAILTKKNGGEPVTAPRLFVGEKRNHRVGLFIRDRKGRKRIQIYVGKDNRAHIKFLDENGNAIPLDSV
jgi:hypothetical protein